MKKISLFLLFFIIALNLSAQHFTFKNIPINGKMSDFIVEMKKNGYTFIEKVNENTIHMMGSFIGEIDSDIFVSCTPKSKIVFCVHVYFQEKNVIKLDRDYAKYITMYTEKYGKPTEQDSIKYNTMFQTDNGFISIQIFNRRFIMIEYFDRENASIYMKENESEIKNDI
jgi:hypothetical protein